MGLQDLRQRLFRKEEDFSGRLEDPELQQHRKSDVATRWQEDAHEEERAETPSRNRTIIIVGVSISVLVLGGFGLIGFLISGGFGGQNTVEQARLTVEGGEEIVSGDKVLWKVTYRNDNAIALEDAELVFQFPESAQPVVGEFTQRGLNREVIQLGTIEPGVQGQEIFSAILFGEQDADLEAEVSLEFRPENSSARLAKRVPLISRVTSTLLGLQLDIPEEVQAGQEITATIKVVSSSKSVFRNLTLGIDYPDNFDFISANPSPTRGDTIWDIGDIPEGDERTIRVRGRINESTSEESFQVQIGLYDQVNNTFTPFNKIAETLVTASTLLSVNLDFRGVEDDDIVFPGDTISVFVNWKNNLPVTVTNAIVEVSLAGEFFDFETLDSDTGEFNQALSALRWIPARRQELVTVEPGQGGTFEFKVDVKETVPIRSLADKNYSVLFRARMSSLDVPVGYEGVNITNQEERAIRIATLSQFQQKVVYYDSRVLNTGPLPPRVGEETTYLVVWSLANSFNDLEDVRIRATLPSYIRWLGEVVPFDPALQFSSRTRELEWRPGDIPAGTGSLHPTREVAFRIGLTPSVPQIGGTPELVSDAIMTGRDVFTKIEIRHERDRLTTSLREDPQAPRDTGAVQEN